MAGWVPQQSDSGMEICTQEIYWGGSLGSTPMGRWEEQDWADREFRLECTGHKELKWSCGEVQSWWWPFRVAPNWDKRVKLLPTPSQQPVFEEGWPCREVKPWARCSLPLGTFPERNPAENHHLQLLEIWTLKYWNGECLFHCLCLTVTGSLQSFH